MTKTHVAGTGRSTGTFRVANPARIEIPDTSILVEESGRTWRIVESRVGPTTLLRVEGTDG